MAAESDVLRTVDLIYEASLDHERWPDALALISTVLGADGASLSSAQRGTLQSLNSGCGDEALRGYDGHWHNLNPLWPGLRAAAPGAVLLDSGAMEPGAYWRSEFYNDFVRPRGLLANMSIKVLGSDAATAIVALHRIRRPGARLFDQADMEHAALLAPHLERAIRINSALAGLQHEAATAGDALDKLPQAVLLVDALAHVLFANSSARALLRSADGLAAGPDGLYAAASAATAELRRRIAQVAAPDWLARSAQYTALALERPSGRRPLSVLIAPSRGPTRWTMLSPRAPVALVLVGEPDAALALPSTVLQSLYGLTRAEAAVALAVVQAQGLQAVANDLGITMATAKTHLQQVFGKTGTRRQAELVRLLMLVGAGIEAAGEPGSDATTPRSWNHS